MIDVEKYFKPHIEDTGCIDYEFQEHLTDYLLRDIIETNEEIEAVYNQVEDFDIIATTKSNQAEKYKQALKDIRDEMSDEYQFGGLSGYEDFCKYYEREYSRIISKIDEVLK